MRIRTVLAAMSVIALSFIARPATAQEGKTICNDGTTSNATGRGACSSHGGVKTKGTANATQAGKAETKAAAKTETKAPEKSAKTAAKAPEKSAKTETKPAAEKSAKTETKAAEKTGKSAPKDVTCTDGTTSKGGRGACSGHGGVKKADSKKKG